MLPTTMLIIAGILALVATVLAFIYVVPEKSWAPSASSSTTPATSST